MVRTRIGTLRRTACLALALALLILGTMVGTTTAQSATWLDSTPRAWNVPAAGPPKAPPLQNGDPRCRTREVSPSSAEESLLTGMGWKLEAYWPALVIGERTLVTALADYDGMCRPLAFNVFVFTSGKYAGTLSPVNMNSRSDGVLDTPNGKFGVSDWPDGRIQAVFTRYAAADPLCCPSRGTTTVTYQVHMLNGSPVLVPVTLSSSAAAIARVPAQMPATGGGGGAGGRRNLETTK
ncbi:MAG: LppP/LprE family lipoprotein [Chloroflexota bacterium]